MSIPKIVTKTTEPAPAAPPSTMSDEHAEELRKLDAAVDRIRKNIPDTPYILTIPSDSRYHVSRHEAESWHRDTPFAPNEEHLQYMSFLYREHGDSCIIARTEVDEERERRERYMKANGIPSGRNTPLQSTGPKKKISLAAYKSKQAGGQEAKQATTHGERKKEVAQLNGDSNAMSKALPASTPKPAVQHGQKRSLEDAVAVNPSASGAQQGSPPPKKARVSPLLPEKPSTINSAPAPDAARHGLPPLLSPPVLPDLLNLSQPFDLPPMLSPTLPPVIEAELARLAEQKRTNPSSSFDNVAAQKSPIAKANGTSGSLSQKEAKANGVGKGIAVVVKKGATAASHERNEARKLPAVSGVKTTRADGEHTSSQVSQGSVPGKPPSLVVKLKYGKKNRKEVERYLKLPPSKTAKQREGDTVTKNNDDRLNGESTSNGVLNNREAPAKPEKSANPSGHSMKGALKRVNSTTSSQTSDDKSRSTPEKRPRPAEDAQSIAPPSKRPKTVSTVDPDKRPGTPTQTSLPSPAQTNRSSAQKPQLVTPRRDFKGVTMTRTGSTESNAATPRPLVTTPSSSRGIAPTSAPASNSRSAEAKTWCETSKRWNDLGRILKHAADAIVRDQSGKPTPADRKKAAVTGIESVLCYMLAYICMDMDLHLTRRTCTVEGSWSTLMPMWRMFERACKPYEHLDGLCLYLGAVICARIQAILVERGESWRTRSDSPGGDNARYDHNQADIDLMYDTVMQMSQYVREAQNKLPEDALINQYPKTWDGRRKGHRLGNWESLSPGEVKGEYCLPLNYDTSPMQAVRMAVVFLKEWIEKEGLEYELRLKL